MKKSIHFISHIIIFFFLSSLIVAFPYLLYTIYPAMGMDFMQALGNSLTTFILCIIALSFLSFAIYRILKPADAIINQQNPGAITDAQKRVIVKKESALKRFLIIVPITSFFIIGVLSVVSNAARVGFLRWATIRFFIIVVLTGPSVAFLYYVFVSYIFQKIKRLTNLFEFRPAKRIVSIKWQIITASLSFFIAVNIMMVFVAISRDETIAGFSTVAFTIREGAGETPHGYFSGLLELCYKSTDPLVQQKALAMKAQWEKDARDNMLYILYIGGVGLLFFGFSLFLLAANISSNLRGITEKLKSFAGLEGDISSLVVKTSGMEIGEIQVLFNRLILNINRTFIGIQETINSLTSGSAGEKENTEVLMQTNLEIHSTSRDIHLELARQSAISKKTASSVREVVVLIKQNLERITSQSSMVEEASAAITELNASIKSVSNITRDAAVLGTQLKNTLQTSLEAAEMMRSAITNITKSGKSITEIASTISMIAGQSNLLAMNAAIEAAHAGIYGRGFAVVADEIRKLSENTDGYAREIVKILAAMNKNIADSVNCSAHLAGAMDKIQGDVNATIRFIDEINFTSQEQLSNSNENMKATESLLNTTHYIMQNLQIQNKNNEQLLDIIAEMEKSTQSIEKVGKKQEEYFEGLGVYFENFLSFFNTINSKLKLLDEKMCAVRLIEKSTLEQYTEE